MIYNFKNNKEYYTFNFKDDNITIINSLRREITDGFDMYYMKITNLKNENIHDVKYEEYEKILEFVYINHNILKKYKDNIAKIKFSLSVENFDGIIYTDSFKFTIDNKKIDPLIRQGLYFMKIEKTQKIAIDGVLSKNKKKPVSTFYYDYDDKNVADVTVSLLELYSFYDLFQIGIISLIDKLKKFQLTSMIKLVKLFENEIKII